MMLKYFSEISSRRIRSSVGIFDSPWFVDVFEVGQHGERQALGRPDNEPVVLEKLVGSSGLSDLPA
jgi:hypothetical protein